MCVGMHVANQTLFIDMATMLWAFEISQDIERVGTAFQLEPRHPEVLSVVERESGRNI